MSSKRNGDLSPKEVSTGKTLYPDFESIVRINKRVVLLTKDEHAFTEHDEQGLRRLLVEVEDVANDLKVGESMVEKVSLLIYGIAGGQHFHEGNKRTALVTAKIFLKANRYVMNTRDKSLLAVVDKVAVGQAHLSNVRDIIRQLIRSV